MESNSVSVHPQVVVRKGAWGAVQARHPWLLAGSVEESAQSIPMGTVVDLVQTDGHWIGRGLINPHSRIRVRIYCWKRSEPFDESLLLRRLDTAIALRQQLSTGHAQEAQRIVFSEADQLSGLIVDRYAEYLIVQLTAAAMQPYLSALVNRLVEVYRPKGVLLRIDPQTAKTEGIEAREEWIHGSADDGAIEIVDNGLRWVVDLAGGQKTGYYLDQRENRMAAAKWMVEGGRALDVCCYVGGFALSLAHWGKAGCVLAIDASQKAIATAAKHAELNSIDRIAFEVGDFYVRLQSLRDAGETFDLIVLDPPKMAGSRAELPAALRAYHRLNYQAIQLLKPGGILVTCSCSGRVDREAFSDMLLGVAKRSGREIQVLERRGASADHPSSITCPETDYLKCFICRVL